MDLADAYRVLELKPGAGKDEAREARNVLAKVWHPDRHQGDPKVHDRAAEKLMQINEAYAVLERFEFPASKIPQREAPPAYVDSLTERAHATPAKPQSASSTHIELGPRRRVRLWVPFVLGAIVAGGAIWFAMARKRDEPAPVVVVEPTKPTPVPVASGFTIGSTRDEVRKIQGEPISTDRTFGERWSYGMAEVTFKNDVVYGWRSSAFDKLKVRLEPKDPKVAAAAKARGTYDAHATQDEVLGVEGTPDGVDDTFGVTWTFGMSTVTFGKDGRIEKVWDTYSNPLHVAK